MCKPVKDKSGNGKGSQGMEHSGKTGHHQPVNQTRRCCCTSNTTPQAAAARTAPPLGGHHNPVNQTGRCCCTSNTTPQAAAARTAPPLGGHHKPVNQTGRCCCTSNTTPQAAAARTAPPLAVKVNACIASPRLNTACCIRLIFSKLCNRSDKAKPAAVLDGDRGLLTACCCTSSPHTQQAC